MFTGLTKSKSSFAHGRAGRQNLARRVDRRSYASSCVSSRRVCNESRPLSLAATTKVVRRFHRNQQYSIVALTNGGGTVTERYAYDAYGTPTITDAAGTTLTTSVDNNRYTYTGREFDEALGLYHYRARMYDSVAGRFCSRDPIGYADGTNLYASYFTLIGTDPSGMRISVIREEVDDLRQILVRTGNRAVAYTGQADVENDFGTATPYVNSWEFDVVSESENDCCASIYAVKPIRVDVLVLTARNYQSSGYANADGAAAIIAHENRRLDVYRRASSAYLDSAREEALSCPTICRSEKGAAIAQDWWTHEESSRILEGDHHVKETQAC